MKNDQPTVGVAKKQLLQTSSLGVNNRQNLYKSEGEIDKHQLDNIINYLF